ncbi:MAG: hypothetical protein JSC085_000586 [Candidatus Tokpelaia sp. JSC085]|nr:MAG: hypothetical protein JSC085_000586 [Candidatus Tokpelaia sp. JSC085]
MLTFLARTPTTGFTFITSQHPADKASATCRLDSIKNRFKETISSAGK